MTSILVEAEEFANYGGWVLDSQFEVRNFAFRRAVQILGTRRDQAGDRRIVD